MVFPKQGFVGSSEIFENAEGGKWNDMKYWASFVLLDGLN